jgi:hypothetical protein
MLTLVCCFQCFDDTEKLQWEHIESEWKQEKQKALSALAGTSEEFLNLSLQPEVKNKIIYLYKCSKAEYHCNKSHKTNLLHNQFLSVVLKFRYILMYIQISVIIFLGDILQNVSQTLVSLFL